ncbi:MAG: D-aminopeptidase [Anaerolineae bacterium]|nr:D-aminopeptidase [Anaerolineae bacterium]
MQIIKLAGWWGLVVGLLLFSARADEPPLRYVAQADDSLLRLADKYYHDSANWPAIFVATNRLAQSEPDISPLESPLLLPPGQIVAIPAADQLESLSADYAGNPPPVAPDTAPLSPAWLADFAAYVEESRQHFEIPGAAVAVVSPQQILLAQGFGERELGRGQPVTPDTLFGIGSTTKAMTSLLAARLVDEGAFGWDTPVSQLWPGFALSDPAVMPQIRLRDLLGMRSGLPRADLVWSGSGMSAEQVMQSLAELPLAAPPGEQFEYNNQAVATAGFAATLAAGGEFGQLGPAYESLLRQRLFEPIGMRRATFDLAKVQADANHATPHDFTLAGKTVPTHFHADPGIDPAGGVNASLLDLARFGQTQLTRGVAPAGQRVVSAANLTQTWQPQIELYPGNSYAMGWFVEEYRGVEMVWHDGDVLGFKSLLVLLPQANLGLALLSNRTVSYGFSNGIRYHFAEQVYGLEADAGQYFRDQWTTFKTDGLPKARAPLNPTPPAGTVQPYLGRYESGWRVEQRPNGAVWASRGDYRWQLWAKPEPGQFIIGNGFALLSPLEFVAEDDRIVMRVELATGEEGTYRRLGD